MSFQINGTNIIDNNRNGKFQTYNVGSSSTPNLGVGTEGKILYNTDTNKYVQWATRLGITSTFTSDGSITLPANATNVQITLVSGYGGNAGNDAGGPGGSGGSGRTATFNYTGVNRTLDVKVGQPGGNGGSGAGPWTKGSPGSSSVSSGGPGGRAGPQGSSGGGGGGGGATGIYDNTLNRYTLVVGGGGGGGGGSYNRAGSPGGDSQNIGPDDGAAGPWTTNNGGSGGDKNGDGGGGGGGGGGASGGSGGPAGHDQSTGGGGGNGGRSRFDSTVSSMVSQSTIKTTGSVTFNYDDPSSNSSLWVDCIDLNVGTGVTSDGSTILRPGDGYEYHIFTSTSGGNVYFDSSVTNIDTLIVAGGGAGGGRPTPGGKGGGGAGGLVVDSLDYPAGTYPVVVGAGGTAFVHPSPAQPENPSGNRDKARGGSSSINGVSVFGGGYGSQFGSPTPGDFQDTPSSGGGGRVGDATNPSQTRGGDSNDFTGQDGGTGYIAAIGAPAGMGGPGGPLFPGSDPDGGAGGGGGGYGTMGGPISSPREGGGGGHGRRIPWMPDSYGTPGPEPGRYFAGGGGGSSSFPSPGAQSGAAGGFGGGGNGTSKNSSNNLVPGTPGTVNTGGGGGGDGGDGGPGIVALRVPLTINKKISNYSASPGRTISIRDLNSFASVSSVFSPGDGYTYAAFKDDGEFMVSSNDGAGIEVGILAVGGGGGGAHAPSNSGGGGGGAGAFIFGNRTIQDGTWSVTVGSKGNGGTTAYNGSDTTIVHEDGTTIRALGGGGGGYSNKTYNQGQPGGSGGGGRGGNSNNNAWITPSYSNPGMRGGIGVNAFGNPGGNVQNPPSFNSSSAPIVYDSNACASGGGGGAGAKGSNTSNPIQGGSGGIGKAATGWNLPTEYGTPGPSPGRWFAGGGGGSSWPSSTPHPSGQSVTAALGGAGGGGSTDPTADGEDAEANTGSGGAGGRSYSGNGADGIVIIRWLEA